MEMLISIVIAFVAEVGFFSFLGRRMFPATSSSQFHSMRAYREFSTKQMLKCRESHIIEAAVTGLTGGLIACYFPGRLLPSRLGCHGRTGIGLDRDDARVSSASQT